MFQRRFEEVRVLLGDAIAAMFAGSNLLASAMGLVSGFHTETDARAHSTPCAPVHVCDTTPPPEVLLSPFTEPANEEAENFLAAVTGK